MLKPKTKLRLGTNKAKERKKEDKRKLHEKLRKVFNRYVRYRDSDSNGNIICISCGKVITFAESQAGHLYPDVTIFNLLRTHEWNVNAQCSHCNCFLEGNTNEYRKNLELKIGTEALKWLDEHARDFIIRDVAWYHEQIEIYTELLKEIEKIKEAL